MIKDLDESIAAMVQDGLLSLGRRVKVSFAAPDDQFPPQDITFPAIDFFLYDIRENVDLRVNHDLVQRGDNGRALRRIAPVRVDCSYIVTAWSSPTIADPWEDEHLLLGDTMRVLLRHRSIPREFLRGVLPSQDLPLPVASLQPGRLQSLGEFWQALGGKPKVTLNYMVTIAVDLGERDVPLVLERTLDVVPTPRAVLAD